MWAISRGDLKSIWMCLSPTFSGGASMAAAGWTIMVPHPWNIALWVVAAYLLYYTCKSFIAAGGDRQ